jgi:hypothetical protein
MNLPELMTQRVQMIISILVFDILWDSGKLRFQRSQIPAVYAMQLRSVIQLILKKLAAEKLTLPISI